MIEIYIDESGLKRSQDFIQAFGSKALPGIARSINRALAGVRTDAYREVKKEYTISRTGIVKSFKIYNASSKDLSGSAVSKGERIGLIHFKPSHRTLGSKKPKDGISVLVGKTRKTIKSSFLAKMPTGQIGIFTRAGRFGRRENSKLEKIEEKKGPAVPQMLGNERVVESLQEKAEQRFYTNLEHEIHRLLNNV